jgi:hypothetical protein
MECPVKILIQKCSDPRKWYANKVGQCVPLLAVEEKEYKSLQDPDEVYGKRFINFVSKDDAILVEGDL